MASKKRMFVLECSVVVQVEQRLLSVFLFLVFPVHIAVHYNHYDIMSSFQRRKKPRLASFFPFFLLFLLTGWDETQKRGMDNTEGGASSYIIEYLLLFVVRITDVAIRFWQKKKSKPKELKQGENMASPGDVADVLWRQSPSVPGWESVCVCVCAWSAWMDM